MTLDTDTNEMIHKTLVGHALSAIALVYRIMRVTTDIGLVHPERNRRPYLQQHCPQALARKYVGTCIY